MAWQPLQPHFLTLEWLKFGCNCLMEIGMCIGCKWKNFGLVLFACKFVGAVMYFLSQEVNWIVLMVKIIGNGPAGLKHLELFYLCDIYCFEVFF